MIALNFLLNCLYSMTILQNTIRFFFFNTEYPGNTNSDVFSIVYQME